MKPLLKSSRWNELRTIFYKGAGLLSAIGVILVFQNPGSNWPYLPAAEIGAGILIWIARYIVPADPEAPVLPPPPQ